MINQQTKKVSNKKIFFKVELSKTKKNDVVEFKVND